jgi:hypothetical protein
MPKTRINVYVTKINTPLVQFYLMMGEHCNLYESTNPHNLTIQCRVFMDQ